MWLAYEWMLILRAFPKAFRVGPVPMGWRKSGPYHFALSQHKLINRHYCQWYADIAALINVPIDNPWPDFPLKNNDRQWALSWIKQVASEKLQRRIIIHMGASNPSQIWPIENYKELIRQLQDMDCKIFLVGSDKERQTAISIADGIASVHILPEISAEKLAAVMAECDLFVGNDSGPFHVAMSVGLSSVVLVGPGKPFYHLYPSGRVSIIRYSTPCSPCNNKICDHMTCMKGIRLKTVLDSIQKMIK
jgi:ADP-heptose:LPS heptosyltransferase